MNISYHDARHILELQDANPTQKLLLFALLSHMHPGTKRIHPSYSTLGNELGCDSRTVLRNIKALSKDGHLVIQKEQHAGRTCNVYVVPFSDGYAYKSEQNDPSVPKPAPKAKDPATTAAKTEPDEKQWDEARANIVYTTPIPSVFVDIEFDDIKLMAFIDARGKRITPRTLQSHIARMWKHCQEKPFFTALEKAWDEYWQNQKKGVYNDETGKVDRDKANDGIYALEEKYNINWSNTNEHDEMHAPNLGFNPSFRYYPDKYEKRKANHVRNPPLDI